MQRHILLVPVEHIEIPQICAYTMEGFNLRQILSNHHIQQHTSLKSPNLYWYSQEKPTPKRMEAELKNQLPKGWKVNWKTNSKKDGSWIEKPTPKRMEAELAPVANPWNTNWTHDVKPKWINVHALPKHLLTSKATCAGTLKITSSAIASI